MRKLIGLFVFLAFVGIQICFSQTREVTGTVIDKHDKSPLPGVSVVVKSNPGAGVATDVNGKFSLKVNDGDVLVFSFIGMKPQEVAVKGQSNFNIEMELANEALDEVMVVAYGTAKKSSFTGSAATVSGDKALKDVPVVSFEQALQGSTPGLTINTNSGQAGSAMSIRIRGTASMNASKNPLYVVDGVPLTSGDIAISGVNGDSKSFNAMASINPNDIENITVLKDAAAASLYGSRAANGVILITTKKGKTGKTQFNFKASWGISDWAVKNREIVNGEQQRELTYEAFYNEAILYRGYSDSDAQDYAQAYTDVYSPKLEKYSDWEGEMFKKNSFVQNYEFSAQGGSETTTFYASLAYKKDEGMVEHSGMEGFTGKINLTHRSSDKLNLGANISFSKQRSNVISEGTSYSNPYFMTRWCHKPNYSIYNEDGSYNEGFPFANLQLPNIVKDKGLDKNTSDVLRSTNSLWASYEFIKGLTLRQTLSYDFILNESTTYWPKTSNNGETHNGLMIKIPYQVHDVYSSTVLNFTRTFNNLHNLDVLVGWDVNQKREKVVQAVGRNYATDKLPELANTSEPMTAYSNVDNDHLFSLLSRLNYDYDNKYYLSATFRRDGSSRLGSNNRWGNFWSVSAAWRMTKENFMQDVAWLNDFKLRASYGVNGTLPNSYYGHLSLFGSGYDYQDEPGSAPTSIPNPDLAWEKNNNLNVGFDATLWDRVNLTFDYYHKKTKDLLQSVPVSYITGFSSSLQNVGSMVNKGIEIDLGVDIFKDTQVKWNTGIILSHNKNEVTKLYEGKDIISGSSIIREGEAYYSFWSREWAGVDSETGEEMWVLNTENPDGSLNKELTKDPSKAQRIVVGKADPDLTGGWRNTVTWKGLSLNALFSFSLGGKIMDDPALLYTDSDGENPFYNIGKAQLKRWQKPGDKTDVPRRINGYQYARYGSDRHMESSNHLRLKSVTLSYALPQAWMKKSGLNSVRIFASGTNLLTWAKYDNIDPEQPIDGFATWSMPPLKTCTFGIEIGL